MAKPLGLEQLLKMAEDEKSISTKVLIQAILDALKAQDAKLDQHAKNFEARAKRIEENVKTYLRDISGVLANIMTRLDKLENPGKTNNNMRQP